MQLILVKNQEQKVHKKGLFDLNDELPSPSPSDSSNDTSKHDYSSEEGEDNLENKRLGVLGKKNKK